MKISPLSIEHYPEVARIYSDGQASGIATFETTVPNWEEFNAKFLPEGRFVLMNDNMVMAWCALTAVSKRAVYKGVAETTLYVDKNSQGMGIGTKLLNHLISESERMGIWTLQARIFVQNKASIGLHEKCGFRIIGIREKIGELNGIWHDNYDMERRSKVVHYK